MDGTRGLGAWQWLFIIEGVATIAIAFGCFFILPNFPRTTKWLTEEERTLAVWYVLSNSVLCVNVGNADEGIGDSRRTLAKTTG